MRVRPFGARTTRTRTTRVTGLLCALALSSAIPAGAALLSEVVFDPVGGPDVVVGGTFVEIWAAPGTSLDGWRVEGIDGATGAVTTTVNLAGSVPANGFYVAANALPATPLFAVSDLVAAFDFQNGPDSIVLRDPSDTIVDAIGYGSFGAGAVFFGEGSAAPTGAEGESLARNFANVDTDDNAADFGVLAVPTPGEGPVLRSVPGLSPAAMVPLAAGLIGAAIAAMRRRPPRRPGMGRR